ncbi:phosphatase PAP2 family protein [Bradyrhizobium sp. BR 10261]|uniref:phosphatase PAP2 family protein n=1 Tax=Bradyrhizobium sp. BR 10261 TaxID=2749992 RepID=UPI001C650D50|nr:phosphatase PAP2 family protein [Bradyrhizobium sp. BR 10261]MBW7960800.1 phosphatase PAP2 family protein [Bradyrhizobium sp. BR 10261]
MALFTVEPTRVDNAIANQIASHTNSKLEHVAEALTWGADEHVLIGLAAAGWVYAQLCAPRQRSTANHILLVSLVTAALPHVLKSVFDQTRPDRLTALGHCRGVPLSGRARDAFPSGHAVHMGALASAAGLLPSGPRRMVRALAVGLSLTRVVLLAHWASDVLAGFTLGIAVERVLRLFTLSRWHSAPGLGDD